MDSESSKVCWFVGASFSGTDDQTERFVSEGIWENGYEDKYTKEVKSILPGDRIAIKSSYTRKTGLSFDNRNQSVSVMAIKAVGTVKDNPGDGRHLQVEWESPFKQREWYFYTYRGTVWRVEPKDWRSEGLIDFAFGRKAQDIDRFRNAPYWRDRFGDVSEKEKRFGWISFYTEMADKLLQFRDRREELVGAIHNISRKVNYMSIMNDQFTDGTSGPLKDICPFTVMGIFNRRLTHENRKTIAGELASFFGMTTPVPDKFEGVPLLNNQKSWFFGYEKDRESDDIDVLWDVFEKAIKFADSVDDEYRPEFAKAYETAIERYNVKWNLSIGLYWARPWNFPTLDGPSKSYITEKLKIPVGTNSKKRSSNATDYLSLMNELENRFDDDDFPVHSFPELSLAAYNSSDDQENVHDDESDDVTDSPVENMPDDNRIDSSIMPYTVDDIIEEGCFLEKERLLGMLGRLQGKKNMILQGPPGTGKTWLAKRLAFALIGKQDKSKIRSVQFHPSFSYEDFIRGWRPSGDGKLTLVDGLFMEMIAQARKDPAAKYVMVIEEINRGNPGQIFGEILTLLEADKRAEKYALELSYRSQTGERIYIPENLYVIGTMNIADRSLAIVDFALRRRFAFIDLEPVFGKPWKDWILKHNDISPETIDEIERRINDLNSEIGKDTHLGKQFRIGHSYLIPPAGITDNNIRDWFHQIVDTEIVPLLNEYWFDDPEKSEKEKEKLLKGFCS